MKISSLCAMAIAVVMCAVDAIGESKSSTEFSSMYAACETLQGKPLEKAASVTVLNAARQSTDPEIRCRAMVIFTISAILQDDPEGYKQRLASMNSIFPENPLILYATPEKLSAACAACEGSGKRAVFCGECNGKGACLACSGTGQFMQYQFDGPDKLVDCKTCGGSGRCKSCQGAGNKETACRNCGGRGQAISKRNAGSAYLEIVKETSGFCYQKMHPEIAQISEAIQNAGAQDLNTRISALQELINQYPKADNIKEAKVMLAHLQEQQKAEPDAEPVGVADEQKAEPDAEPVGVADEQESTEGALSERPAASEQVSMADEQQSKEKLLSRQRRILAAARDAPDSETSIRSLKAFIKNYPDSPYMAEVQSLLRELEAKRH